MKNLILAIAILFTGSLANAADLDPKVVAHLQDVSVTVVTEKGSGSGIVFTRTFGDHTVSFVHTAAHVVDGLRHVKQVIDGKTGTPRLVVEFDDAKVVKTLIEDGRTIGRTEVDARVLKYNAEEDFAVLQVRQKNFTNQSVTFYLDPIVPPLATPVVHVGSLLGEGGSNSVTLGIISQHGRLIKGKIFDQTTATAFPGSSGGGVFLYDGRLIGQVLRGSGEQFIFIGPARRSIQWAKDAGIEWVVNHAVQSPSENDLRKIIVEDNGVSFDAKAASVGKSPHKKMIYNNSNLLWFLPH